MNTRIYLFLLVIAGCITSCEDVIDLELPEGDAQFVVDGWLFDQEGEKIIRLSTTTNYFHNSENPPVTGATVLLFNSYGAIDQFSESAPGKYTSLYAGEVGETYHIYIETTDGEVYQSLPEILTQVPEINAIYAEYKEKVNFKNDEGYFVSIDTYDPEEFSNYYRWKQYLNGEYLNKPDDLFFASDEFVNGNPSIGLEINAEPLKLGDHFRVQQLSISRAAFDFITQLEIQTANVGSMFDSPPIAIKGNIIRLDQENQNALGFFGVSALSEREISIE